MPKVRRTFFLTAVLMMLCITAPLQADTPHPGPLPGFEEKAVFTSGKDGYLFYRVPSAVVSAKGTILVFAEARRSPWGPQNDAGEINVVLKRSTDNGQTFSEQKLIWADGPNTCGNPTAVVDQQTGSIVLVMCRNDADTGESPARKQEIRNNRTVWVTISDDDGVTWSAPRDITTTVKQPGWTWYATGPGIGIQVQNGQFKGRLVIPCNHSGPGKGGGTSFSHVIFSDDHGKTWTLGGSSPVGEGNESQIVEQSDGTLMLNMRNARPKGSTPAKARAIAISKDGGVSFGDFRRDPVLIEPVCQASILRFSWQGGGEKSRIIFANPASETQRTDMTVRISYDEGITWPTAALINKGWSCYSSLVRLPDGNVGLFYEAGTRARYETITFAKLSLQWLESNKAKATTQSSEAKE